MMSDPSVFSLLNPLSSKPYAPKFFKPFGDSSTADKYNRKAFQVATIVPLYALLGVLARNSMGVRSEELEKLDKLAPIATSMTSGATPSSFGSKQGSDLLYQSTSTTIPLLMALASFFGGMKIADKHKEDGAAKEYNAQIEELEQQYNRELAKRMYPNSRVKMPEASKVASDAIKEASISEDLLGALGIMQYLAPLGLAVALGSGYAAKKYFDANSKQRKKAVALRKGLEAKARVNWVPKMELPEDVITGETTV